MLGLFIAAPWLALVPAALFGFVWFGTRRRSSAVAALVWLAYAFYEEGMRRRILCSGECNIRVDLLLLYPSLLALTIGAAVVAFRRRGTDGRPAE